MLYGPIERRDSRIGGRAGPGQLLHHLLEKYRRWRQLTDDISRLRRLDDRLLADLDIPREEIAARVRGRH